MEASGKMRGRCGAVLVDPGRDHAWEKLVREHAHAVPAHLEGWRRMLIHDFPHLDAVYLGIRDTGEMAAGLPLFYARSRLAGNRLLGLPFATFADPLVETRSQLHDLLDAARVEAGRLGADRIELRCTRTADLAQACGMVPTRRYKIHILRLDRRPEQLLKSFDRTCVRQQIKKSLKGDLELFPVRGPAGVGEFYRLYVLTRKRLRLPPQPPELFAGLFRELGPTGNAEILLARRDGVVVGGLFTLRHGRRTSFEHVGVDPAYRGPSVFHFLYWKGILRAIEQGSEEVDFGRTDETNIGLMKFKERWNTEASDLVHLELPTSGGHVSGESAPGSNASPHSFRYRALQKACDLAPNPALIRLGRFCYKHYM